MFDIYCHHHGSRVLVGPRAIDALVNTPDGVVLHWHCYCGARGSTRFGRRAAGACRALGAPVEPAA
jgi:hypothetical protein